MTGSQIFPKEWCLNKILFTKKKQQKKGHEIMCETSMPYNTVIDKNQRRLTAWEKGTWTGWPCIVLPILGIVYSSLDEAVWMCRVVCVSKFIRTVVCECRDIYYTLYVRVRRHSIHCNISYTLIGFQNFSCFHMYGD